MNKHDASYRQLFSNPLMIQSLFEGILQAASPEAALPAASELDWPRAEALPASFITKDLRQRQSDCIWRIPRHGGDTDLHLLLLLEFQSTNDIHMALRITIYVLLLYESLIKQKKIQPGDPYPLVLPVVLYNGVTPWTAATRLADKLEASAALSGIVPGGGYILVDEGELLRRGKVPRTGLMSLLIQLEHCQSIEQFQQLVHTIITQTADPVYAPVREALLEWTKHVLWPRNVKGQDASAIRNFQEFNAMLIEGHVSWTDKLLMQGMEKGEAALLGRLLTRKFGTLSQDTQERLSHATPSQLEAWSLNLLDAKTLDDVFLE